MTAKKKAWLGAAITIVTVGIFAAHYLFPKDPSRTFLNSAGNGWSYIRGYFAGMGWAKADIEENRALILGGGALLDQETGLRAWALDCTADLGMAGVADGYNRIVRLWVHLKGPPSYSRKRWEDILFHLTEYFDKRAETEPPESFVVNGPPILASDGETKVFLRFRQPNTYLITWDAKLKSPFWSPLQDNGPFECSTSPLWPNEGVLLYYPGPPGSDLLFLRGRVRGTKDAMTMAFDMRWGFLLKWDPPI